jgi:hypothetical protein
VEDFDILVTGRLWQLQFGFRKLLDFFAGLTMDSNEHASSSSIPFMFTGKPTIHFEIKQDDDLLQFSNQF